MHYKKFLDNTREALQNMQSENKKFLKKNRSSDVLDVNNVSKRRDKEERSKGTFNLKPTTVNHFTGKHLSRSRSGTKLSSKEANKT